jgi:hypothetical protein
MTRHKPNLLKNGHPALVLTYEDRRRGMATTNAIKRAQREAFEDERFERAVALMFAWNETRRARRRARYERWKHQRGVSRQNSHLDRDEDRIPCEKR